MSSSRHVEDTYESQNDQRLDDLHSKIRTLRVVTTDIQGDVERQNLMLDETGNQFSTFGSLLTQTSRRAGQVFGIGQGSLKTWRIVLAVVAVFIGFWIASKVLGFWWSREPAAGS